MSRVESDDELIPRSDEESPAQAGERVRRRHRGRQEKKAWQTKVPAAAAAANEPDAPLIPVILAASPAVAVVLQSALTKQHPSYINCSVTHKQEGNTVTYTADYTENSVKKTSTTTLTLSHQEDGSTLFTCKSDRPLKEQYFVIATQSAEARKANNISLNDVKIALPDVSPDADRTNTKYALKSAKDQGEKKTPLSEKECLAIRAYFQAGFKSVTYNGNTYLKKHNADALAPGADAVQVQEQSVGRPQPSAVAGGSGTFFPSGGSTVSKKQRAATLPAQHLTATKQ